MKKIFFFILAGLIIVSCSDINDNVISTENNTSVIEKSSSQSNQITEGGFQNIFPVVTKTIDGSVGGEILYDETINVFGIDIRFYARLKIPKNAFSGVQEITMMPNPFTLSAEFYPEMEFNKPLELDEFIQGVDLEMLGFTNQSDISFAYICDDGTIEYTTYGNIYIKLSQDLIGVRKAKIPHFSRWGFVRKN